MKEKNGFWQEFKAFVSRGNVLDLAVGIIIGSAFTAIVTALVNGIIMPIIGFLLQGVNFSDLKIVLSPAQGEVAEVAILWGAFVQQVMNFLIVAFVVFCMIKAISSARRKQDAQAEAEQVHEAEELLLLREIRDSLQK